MVTRTCDIPSDKVILVSGSNSCGVENHIADLSVGRN